MGTSTQNKVSALFRNRESADAAYQAAMDRGYSQDDLNVAMTEDARNQHYPDGKGVAVEEGNKAAEGAGIGGGIGTITGGLIGAIAAIGTTLVIPGLNLLIAGPLAAGLAGAGAGALTGGLIGALVGWGMPEKYAKEYETSLKEGQIALGITTRTEADATAIETDWRSRGAARVDRY